MSADSSRRVVVAAFTGNGFLAGAKLAAWFLTGSPSMLAEAIHSVADTANQFLLYVGVRQSHAQPTREFPMGRGSARYMWNLISAVGIFFVGFGVTTSHGVYSLIAHHDAPVPQVDFFSSLVLVAAFLVEGGVFLYALKAVNRARGDQGFWSFLWKGDDPTAVAVLLEDGVAVLGVVTAFVSILISRAIRSPIPDAVGAIFIGVLLGILAILLAKANARLLMGVAAPSVEEQEIREFIEGLDKVERVVKLRTQVLGPDRVRLQAEVEFHGGVLIDREQLIRDAEKIRSGSEDPLPVLVDTADRTVRTVGNQINTIERQLSTRFPQLVFIDLEVN